jgi:hypothetical protein
MSGATNHKCTSDTFTDRPRARINDPALCTSATRTAPTKRAPDNSRNINKNNPKIVLDCSDCDSSKAMLSATERVPEAGSIESSDSKFGTVPTNTATKNAAATITSKLRRMLE